MLLQTFTSLMTEGWRPVFSQQRTQERAVAQALSLPLVLGRRTVSRSLCALNRADQDWSADYKLFSRSPWEAAHLFDPVWASYLERYPRGPVTIALDDSLYPKTGKKIPGAHWHKDPLSPPFHVNLRFGLRFLQASLLFPLHQEGGFSARAIPIAFDQAPALKKPGKRASQEEWRVYRHLKKEINLSCSAVQQLTQLRKGLDNTEATHRPLWAVLDGSFCNRTLFRAHWDRVILLARCRKDARLCYPAMGPGRRQYQTQLFTPESVRTDSQGAWKRVRIYYANRRRWIRVKERKNVLWRRGAGTQPLRLIVIAPQPYKIHKKGRTYYREPAYLLTTGLTASLQRLVQAYFDRWQIEVNHRDQKSLLGVGQAQVHSPKSVLRHPALSVASYSLLLVAGLQTYGPGRSQLLSPLPKWRNLAPHRFSTLDLLSQLRREINETAATSSLTQKISKNLMTYAYT
jgi:hypothetical protein